MFPNGCRLHAYLGAEIGGTPRAYVKPRGLGRVYLGETGFDLTLPDEPVQTVLGADVAFLRAERVPPTSHADYIPGAPDLAVEIASPSQFRPEMGAKAWLWPQRGARLVWVVWPQREQVDVWLPDLDVPMTLNRGETLDGGRGAAGLRASGRGSLCIAGAPRLRSAARPCPAIQSKPMRIAGHGGCLHVPM